MKKELTPLQLYACQIPKCELHVHLEGTLEPEMMLKFATKNGVKLKYANKEEIRDAYNFTSLSSFLDIYYQGSQVLVTEDDFYELTIAYLKRVKQDNVEHAEMMFDPQSHTSRGVLLKTCIDGIHRARLEASRELGVSTCLIACFLRELSTDKHNELMNELLPFLGKIDAVGLDSYEGGFPCRNFREQYLRAKEYGLKRVAHAGEEGKEGVTNIAEAIDILNCQRIDHGVMCVKDLQLVDRLKQLQIPLTVCPISNVKLQVVKNLQLHPLLKLESKTKIKSSEEQKQEEAISQIPDLIQTGLKITINSDDPAYLGAYINDNFIECADKSSGLNWSYNTIKLLAMNSVEASFTSDEHKDILRKKIREFDENFVKVEVIA